MSSSFYEVGIENGLKTETQYKIIGILDKIEKLLIEKNRKYGDSALKPTRVFSQASTLEQLKVRIDDKLSRVRSSQADDDEDVIVDLIGYLILYLIALESNETGQ
jgi:hypothetical protein